MASPPHKRLTRAALLLLPWIGLPLHAELLTPEQAVAYALENSTELAAAQAQSQAAEAQIGAARAGRLPQVSASYTARTSNNPLDAFADKLNTRSVVPEDFDPDRLNNPGSSRLHIAELSMQVPVYTGGRLEASIRGAREVSESAQLEQGRARERVAAETLLAYRSLQAAQQRAAIVRDAVTAAQAHVGTTARLVRQGRTVLSDRLTAEVNLSAIQGLLEQALGSERLARNQLKLVMGLPLDAPLQVRPWEPVSPPEITVAPDQLADQALVKRKDLAAMAAQVEASRAQEAAARAETRARVDVVAATNWYDRDFAADNNSWSVMGVVSKPLFTGGRARYQARSAAYQTAALEAQLRGLERGIRNEVRAAYSSLREAEARLALANENVERARRTVGLVNQRYGEGRTILIDLLQAERALVEARSEELAAAHNLAESYIALQLAMAEI